MDGIIDGLLQGLQQRNAPMPGASSYAGMGGLGQLAPATQNLAGAKASFASGLLPHMASEYERLSGEEEGLRSASAKSLEDRLADLRNADDRISTRSILSGIAHGLSAPTKFGSLGESLLNVGSEIATAGDKGNALKENYRQMALELQQKAAEQALVENLKRQAALEKEAASQRDASLGRQAGNIIRTLPNGDIERQVGNMVVTFPADGSQPYPTRGIPNQYGDVKADTGARIGSRLHTAAVSALEKQGQTAEEAKAGAVALGYPAPVSAGARPSQGQLPTSINQDVVDSLKKSGVTVDNGTAPTGWTVATKIPDSVSVDASKFPPGSAEQKDFLQSVTSAYKNGTLITDGKGGYADSSDPAVIAELGAKPGSTATTRGEQKLEVDTPQNAQPTQIGEVSAPGKWSYTPIDRSKTPATAMAVMAKVSPDTIKKSINEEAANAGQSMQDIGKLQTALDSLDRSKKLGPGASVRAKYLVLKSALDAPMTTGEKNDLDNYMISDKAAIDLALGKARNANSRFTQAEFVKILDQGTPNAAMTAEAVKNLLDAMKYSANMKLERVSQFNKDSPKADEASAWYSKRLEHEGNSVTYKFAYPPEKYAQTGKDETGNPVYTMYKKVPTSPGKFVYVNPASKRTVGGKSEYNVLENP